MLTKTKRWGNSLAIVIPMEKVRELKLKIGEDVNIRLERKSNILKDLFGAIHFSKSADELLKDARKNISKWS